jgi:hypothetical protein
MVPQYSVRVRVKVAVSFDTCIPALAGVRVSHYAGRRKIAGQEKANIPGIQKQAKRICKIDLHKKPPQA